MLTADVATTRGLLARYPVLGSPPLGLTEYGDLSNRLLPGWIVGDMAALESSGVAFADRTCAVTMTDPSAGDECGHSPSTLDGLLLANGNATAAYWAYRVYATFHGSRISTWTPTPTMSILGTRDATAVRLLIGRHQTCTQPVNADCTDAQPLPPPVSVPLVVTVPWASPTTVTIDRIANVRGPAPPPARVRSEVVTPSRGVVTLTVAGVGDGDAFVVTLQH
jgi:hypothetical protein